jgi:hypothetical protein
MIIALAILFPIFEVLTALLAEVSSPFGLPTELTQILFSFYVICNLDLYQTISLSLRDFQRTGANGNLKWPRERNLIYITKLFSRLTKSFVICILYLGDEIKKKEIGEACGMCGGDKKCI